MNSARSPKSLFPVPLRWVSTRKAAAGVLALSFVFGMAPVLADEAGEVVRLTRAGQYNEALAVADGVLAKKPRDPQMRFLKGVTLAKNNRSAEAIAVFSKLTEDHPSMPEPYNNLAVLYAASGQYEKARIALDKAIRSNPAYSTAFDNLGNVHARLASQAYDKALQNDSKSNESRMQLALVPDLGSAAAPATAPAAATAPSTPAASARPGKVVMAPTASAPAATPAPAAATKPTPAQVAVTPPKPAAAPAVVTPAPAARPAAPAAAPATQVAQATQATPASPAAPVVSAAAARAKAREEARLAQVAAREAAREEARLKARQKAEEEEKREARVAAENAPVLSAVNGWAREWSARDVAGYLSYYSPEFDTPPGMSRKAWADERRARIVGKAHIDVKVESPEVRIDGNTATVVYRQTYVSDRLTVRSRKVLVLAKQKNGKWLIQQERSGS